MMRRKVFGTFLYYLTWPLIWFYGPLNIRVRVVIRNKSDILLVKNWFGPNIYQLPGGGKKFNEKPIDTAVREIKEELGINIENKCELLSDEIFIVRSNGILYRYFYVVADFSNKPIITPNKEISQYSWEKNNSKIIPRNIQLYL